jgi:hypothetical protein
MQYPLKPSRKALFQLFFLVLVIDITSFTLINLYPEVFSEFLINHLGPEAYGLAIIGGIIIAITALAALLLLSFKELKT